MLQDAVWVYFGWPNPHWSTKCNACRARVTSLRQPVEECVNCWKIEVWFRGKLWQAAHQTNASLSYSPLSELAHVLALRGIVSKVSVGMVPVIRSGLPKDAYPDVCLDYLLMAYAERINDRDEVRTLIAREALVLNLPVGQPGAAARLLPARRGCWSYDEILGPWENWYLLDEDWPGKTRSP